MQKIKSIYLKLLLGAVIIYAIGVTIMLSDLYNKVGELEHDMMHLSGAKNSPVCRH